MIKYHIDHPGEGIPSFSGSFLISGWALSSNAPVTVDVSIDGLVISSADVDLSRPDVATAFPQYRNNEASGFSVVLKIENLAHSVHSLEIKFSDSAGNIVKENRKFNIVPAPETYHQYYVSEKEVEYAELQGMEEKSSVDLVFLVRMTKAELLDTTLRSITKIDCAKRNLIVFCGESEISEVASSLDKFENISSKILTSIHSLVRELYLYTWVSLLGNGELIDRKYFQQLEIAGLLDKSDAIYSDHDHYLETGMHCNPVLKPKWSNRLYLAKNYVGGSFCSKASKLIEFLSQKASWNSDSDWRYDLLLRIHEAGGTISSIQKFLISKPDNCQTDLEFDQEVECVKSHLNRVGVIAAVDPIGQGIRRIVRKCPDEPKVSIIIPTTGKMKYVKPCVDSIIKFTAYENYELIFIDNGRGENRDGITYIQEKGIRVIERFEPFNWAKLNNDGVNSSDGELLLFLNDDMEVVSNEWLTELVRQISQPDVGAVGCMLLYPNGFIQHAGVFLVDHGGGARHWLQFLDPKEPLFQDYQKVVREVCATTGACLMIKRSVWQKVGGFDQDLPVVGNDVDICLKIREAGYSILWTPDCSLIHHESVSRKEISYTEDEQKMWNRWGAHYLAGDPFYNQNLSLYSTDCILRSPRVLPSPLHDRVGNERGLNLIGYIKAEMGVGEGARGVARALETTAVRFQIINYEKGNPSRMGDESLSHRIGKNDDFPVSLWHINADLLPKAMEHVSASIQASHYNIGFWAWELPEFPERWCSSIDLVDEVWVPSTFVAEAIRARTNKPVQVMPHPIVKNSIAYYNRKFFDLCEDDFIFLVAYDVHSIRQRKNPEGAIRAFKEAFQKDKDQVKLIIKINNATPAEIEYINGLIGEWKNIQLMTKMLTRFEMDSLMSAIDCFVSLHRSEGFGLAIAEAMILGKPTIATNWSGNRDFMGEGFPLGVDYRLSELEKSYGPYEKGQIWAEPNELHAAELMKSIVSDRDLASDIGQASKLRIETYFSPAAVGKIMEKRICEIETIYSQH